MILTGERFCRIGEAMYGPRWKPVLAQMLCRDNRMIRYYCDGHAVPVELAEKLLVAAEARYDALGRAIEELRKAVARDPSPTHFRVSGNQE